MKEVLAVVLLLGMLCLIVSNHHCSQVSSIVEITLLMFETVTVECMRIDYAILEDPIVVYTFTGLQL